MSTTAPRSRRILIVDDNPAIHDDFRKILVSADTAAAADLADLEAELFAEVRKPSPAPT